MKKKPTALIALKHLVKTKILNNQNFQKDQFSQIHFQLQAIITELENQNATDDVPPPEPDLSSKKEELGQQNLLAMSGTIGSLSGRMDNLDNALLNISAMVTALSARSPVGQDDLGALTGQINTVTGQLDNLDNALLNVSTLIGQSQTSTAGLVTRADFANLSGRLDNLDNALVNISAMVAALYEHPTTLESATREASLQSLSIAAMVRRQGMSTAIIAEQAAKTHYSKAAKGDYETRLTNLEKMIPQTFPKWQKLFENGKAAYEASPEGSLAQWGDIHAEGFRNFCSINMNGRVLDIGSGPRGKPFYLQDYPSQFISTIEPLKIEADVDFELVRAFNEDLPWPDQSFNTVINSTSLDHVLDLDKSLEETHRVLVEDGKFIVWIGSIPGGVVYDPHNPDLEPIDEFHLFHIEQSWFEPYLNKWFRIEEKIEFPNASFTHIFYVFSKR